MIRTLPILRRSAGLMLWSGCFLCAAAMAQQASYPTPDAAASAFVQAVRANDQPALAKVLGGDWKDYIPTEGIQRADVDLFLKRYDETHRIDTEDGKARIDAGKDNWVLPIPMVQASEGWRFDLKGAQAEIRVRRIGANELAAQAAMLAYYDAQREYASEDRDSNKVLEYAQRFVSSPGKHDGLYWPVTGNEPESPLGPAFDTHAAGEDYHGYYYRILTAQGPSAPGGAYNYIVGGRMTSGFAMIAWPSKYGETGVMSFMVSHDGEIFEKDLGKNGAKVAGSMKLFDPDSSWQEVQPVH